MRPFLTANWRQLAMLNYEVPPAILAPLVPRGTILDTFAGRTLVSMVGFLFENTRVLGLPIPFHVNFEEVNLRFYVRRETSAGVRRGVVFVKEIVPRSAIALVARHLYNEPYVAMPMRHSIDPGRKVHYGWRHAGAWNSIDITTAGDPFLPAQGSEAEFITEHYWGYTAQRDGSTKEYEVRHPQWRVSHSATAHLDCQVSAIYGQQFEKYLLAPPCSAFLAEGSAVSVFSGRPI
jgi:uncharacterized protein YqjF (DUF2071 family)